MTCRLDSRLFVSLSCVALLLAACGDDGSPSASTTEGTGDDTSTGSPTTTMASVDSSGGNMSMGTTGDMPMTTGVDTTAGDTTGGGTTEGDTSADSGTTTGAGLDCTGGMSFDMLTSADNDLVTNLDVAGVVNCNQDITITATGGTVCAIDDGAGGYFYTVETIALEDVPPVTCGAAEVGITNMSIVNLGDGMEVVVPQAGGAMTGNQSVQVQGDVSGTALGNQLPATPLMDFDGVLPEGDAAFGGADTTVSWADDMTVVATAMPEVIPGISVTVTLTGLDGSLTFAM